MQEQIKDRLRKLFRVAENDASCDGEIESAMALANQLMSAHQITRDDVFEDENGEVNLDKVTYGQTQRYSLYTSICAWESYLCKFITEFIPGTGYYVKRGTLKRNKAGMVTQGKATLIVFYGAQTDVEFAAEIFDEVTVFVQAAARLRYGSALARGEAAAYAEGFAVALYEAHKQEAKKLENTSDSKALIVVNRGLALREGGRNWLREEKGIRLSKGSGCRSQSGKSTAAYKQGQQDGKDYKPAATKTNGYLS